MHADYINVKFKVFTYKFYTYIQSTICAASKFFPISHVSRFPAVFYLSMWFSPWPFWRHRKGCARSRFQTSSAVAVPMPSESPRYHKLSAGDKLYFYCLDLAYHILGAIIVHNFKSINLNFPLQNIEIWYLLFKKSIFSTQESLMSL